MPIKKSVLFFIALAVSSVSLLVFPSSKIVPAATPAKCCKQVKETEVFSPWSMLSPSMMRTKA